MGDLTGTLVEVRGRDDLGTGRIESVDSGVARVEWFESIAQPVAHRESVKLGDCRRKVLVPQTRAYWRHSDRWFVGRVVWGDGGRYALRLPNSKQDIPVPGRELYVRWSRPVADPIDVLLAGGAESPYFRDTRIPFLASLVAQRAASGGLPALLSSAVELYPHQIRAARQVLADPVQRYLLADEVGLGKTIEAGFVLRQYLIDNPGGSVLVIAPEELRRQWQQELRDKFFIDDFPAAAIRLASHSSPSTWARDGAVGLTVVDEAHRLVDADDAYDALRQVCVVSERLLLLSATPILHREQQMLRLLHVLDPEMYDLADVAAFKDRVRSRHDVAMAFYALDPDFAFMVPDHIETIRKAFSSDATLTAICDRVVAAAVADAQAELRHGIEELRAHVNEAYRLHRRIIRQRREAIVGRDSCGPDSPPFEVTGRGRPAVLRLEDDVWDERDRVLESWRNAVLQDVEDGQMDGEAVSAYGRLFSRLIEVAADPLSSFGLVMQSRLAANGEGGRLPSAPSVGQHEGRVLAAVESTLVVPVEAVLARLSPVLRAHPQALAVFVSDAEAASRLAGALRQAGIEVAAHHGGRDPAEVETELQAWLRGDASVLVADASAEEGRNLQSAVAVVHLGLPMSINRLEQRLGRVDRHGVPAPARQYLMLPQDREAFASTWASTAVQGYGVFDRSLSTLQYALADLYETQSGILLDSGAGGLRAWQEELATTLDARRRDIAAEDMLEASFVADGDGRSDFGALDALEADWRSLEAATEALLAGAPGNLGFAEETPRKDPGTRKYSPAKATLVPMDMLARAVGNAAFESPVVYNRTAALRRPGVRLARSGSVLVDALEQIVQYDDRGQASALWRYRREWRREPVVYFGMQYLVEADIGSAVDAAEDLPDRNRALRRRADQMLPPFLTGLWLPAFSTSPVQDRDVLYLLNARYEPERGGDTNLSFERRRPLFELLNGPEGFAEACETARTAGHSAVTGLSDLDARAEALAARAQKSLDRELSSLAARRRSDLLFAKAECGVLTPEVSEALVQGVARPTVRLTSVALVVLANRGWSDAA